MSRALAGSLPPKWRSPSRIGGQGSGRRCTHAAATAARLPARLAARFGSWTWGSGRHGVPACHRRRRRTPPVRTDETRTAQRPLRRRARLRRARALRRARRAKWAARRWAARRRRSSAGSSPSGSTARSKLARKAARAGAVSTFESYRAWSRWAPIRPRRARSAGSLLRSRAFATASVLVRSDVVGLGGVPGPERPSRKRRMPPREGPSRVGG
jgi:hypothetical protein